MRPWILKGSKQHVAESVARMKGETIEAIVFIDEPVTPASPGSGSTAEELFAEMEALSVRAGDADDSRVAANQRVEGE